MQLRIVFCAIAIALSSSAFAELKGSYQIDQKKSLDLYYLDDQHMRVDIANQNQLVLKNSQSWILHRQGDQWLGVDADQAAAVLKSTHGNELQKDIGPVELRDTGRTETVAGYKGKVFELQAGDNRYELVLTDNPDVLALTNGWRKLALRLSQSLGAEQTQKLQQALSKIPERGMGGLLRQDNQLVLTAVAKNIKASDVDMPPNTQLLPKFQIPGLN